MVSKELVSPDNLKELESYLIDCDFPKKTTDLVEFILRQAFKNKEDTTIKVNEEVRRELYHHERVVGKSYLTMGDAFELVGYLREKLDSE